MNFYEISLNKQEYNALCALYEARAEKSAVVVSAENASQFYHLQELGLACVTFAGGSVANKAASLTDSGLNYYYFARARRHDKRFENTRYWITTVIALLALALSALALLCP